MATLACALNACSDARPEDESSTDEARASRVLLIGIDGVRPDVLAEVSTPNMDALAEDGFLIESVRTTTPSMSGPSWSSMLTGVWPDKHGVTSNDFTGKRYDEYPDFLTRVESLEPERSTVAIADWLPLLRADEGLATVSDAVDVKHVLDGYELGWPEADARVTELAVEALAEGDPDAIFVYLGNPDETSHEHGSIGAEYRSAIGLADLHVGRIVDALHGRDTFGREDWLILISTDHGRRADGGHGGASPEEMTTFVIGSGAAARAATPPASAFIVDVAATALEHLGVDVSSGWGLDGSALASRTSPPGR